MTKLINTIARTVLFGAAVLCVFSCRRELFEAEVEMTDQEIAGQAVNDGEGQLVHFRAAVSDTKAQFGEAVNGERPTLWTSNDTELKLSLNYGTALTAGVEATQDGTGASFDATIDFSGIDGPYTFYAVSPSSQAKALSPSREAWKVSIPSVQTPSQTSVDESAIIIAATSASYSSTTEIGAVDMTFNHLTAYGRMSLSNLDLGSEETISAVELTVITPIVGDWYWKCEPDPGEDRLIDYGASSTLTINTSRTNDIWFGCAPVDVSDEAAYVTVYTSAGTYEQTILFPDGCQFTAGQCAVFSVDMTDAYFTAAGSGSGSGSGNFELVTDASTLAVGDEVLIVYTSGSKALGSSAGNYRNPADVSITNNAISDPGDATVLTLVAGTTSGTFAFFDGSYYLSSPTSSNNYLHSTLTSVNENASWRIEISNGAATITAQAGTRTLLKYNSSSPRFSCYASGQNAVSIFRRSASSGGSSTDDPLLEKTIYGCYLGTELEWEYNPGTDQVTRSYDEYGFETYTLIKPSNVEELEITGYKKGYLKGDGNISITINWRRGTSTVLSQVYKMKIIKEDGPKVWLSDGTHGVIIKRCYYLKSKGL